MVCMPACIHNKMYQCVCRCEHILSRNVSAPSVEPRTGETKARHGAQTPADAPKATAASEAIVDHVALFGIIP